MTNAAQPRTWVRAINTAFAVALAVFVLANYWPIVKVLDLWRADLQVQSEWIGGHAKKITAVTPGGVADRAGLKAGDVLEFDPGRDADWVLAGYRHVPEGFSGTLPVQRADGTRSVVTLVPERVAYLPTLNDRVALLARVSSLTWLTLVGVFMVWARPGLMTWSLLLSTTALAPINPWVTCFLAFGARPNSTLLSWAPIFTWPLVVALVPFAACFPRNSLTGYSPLQRALGLTLVGAMMTSLTYRLAYFHIAPFEPETAARATAVSSYAVAIASCLIAIAALARTYHRSDDHDRARLKWALLGVAVVYASYLLIAAVSILAFGLSAPLSGRALTPLHWLTFLVSGVLFPFSLGYAVLRQRIVDVQFAISRTLVYGIVSTIVVVSLAVLHWLLGRMIEQSRLAFGLEGLAAVGLGFVLHRASHGITVLVDRVLFRKHHQAEERLRRVTAALPFAGDERAIAEALVTEPVRSLNLASAALFYRESSEGPLRRVLAQGWNDAHAASLEADSLLVRYLQAEHEPLKLDDLQLLPVDVPEGAGLPVLAIPIVNQHVLAAVVLYGAHSNHTLLDPDEIELLHALAKAAATSHSQVRIAMLQREVAALSRKTEGLEREKDAQHKMIERFEALVQTRMTAAGEGT